MSMIYEVLFPTFGPWLLLFARVVLGGIMIYYGWPKFTNLAANAKDFRKMGFIPGALWGTIVAFVEFVGGLMLIIGFGVWLAAFALAIEMLIGATWKITSTEKPFTDYSYDLLILALALLLFAFGPGALSFVSL